MPLQRLINDPHGTATFGIKTSDLSYTARFMKPFGEKRGETAAVSATGTVTSGTTWPTTRGFAGGVIDPTGLTHLGAREYDSDTGRFVSVDPILAVGDPQQWNGYSYANNNPTTYKDPTGLLTKEQAQDRARQKQAATQARNKSGNVSRTTGNNSGHRASGTRSVSSGKGSKSVTVPTKPFFDPFNDYLAPRLEHSGQAQLLGWMHDHPVLTVVLAASLILLTLCVATAPCLAMLARNALQLNGIGMAGIAKVRARTTRAASPAAAKPGPTKASPATKHIAPPKPGPQSGGPGPASTSKELAPYWPPSDGFMHPPVNVTLRPGTQIDRYGYEGGKYVAPRGTPFNARALPPQYESTMPCRAYEVITPLHARAGISAPWFSRRGGGVQYHLDESITALWVGVHFERWSSRDSDTIRSIDGNRRHRI